MLGALVLAAMISVPKAERDAAFDKPPQNTLRDCGSEPLTLGECRLPPNLSAQDAQTRLAGKGIAWWREGDQFIVVAKRDTDQAFLCCAARGRMDHIDGDLWALRLRIADLDHATIDVSVLPLPDTPAPVYRGPAAPPALASVANLQGHLYAEVVNSHYLDSPRGVLIYTPPNFDRTKKYPVVYMADGSARLHLPGFIEPLILSGALPPMILVAIWPGNSHKENEDLRSEEYLLGWSNGYSAFLKHESFLLKEVLPLVEQKYGASSDPNERIITGFSSGAAWAISMGLRHPDIFSTVIAQSLGWSGGKFAGNGTLGMALAHPGSFATLTQSNGSGEFESELTNNSVTRFYLSAGTLEPVFYDATLKFADEAKTAGHTVRLETTVSGHTQAIWTPLLVHGLQWAFANRAPAKP
ncbi:MAG TPA: alpha/beta hydrolase-fold protein [Rhizomicrobium sp.]|nr:alpha/beta hydrolase-fold protein [Rhizomicrobium sp.]